MGHRGHLITNKYAAAPSSFFIHLVGFWHHSPGYSLWPCPSCLVDREPHLKWTFVFFLKVQPRRVIAANFWNGWVFESQLLFLPSELYTASWTLLYGETLQHSFFHQSRLFWYCKNHGSCKYAELQMFSTHSPQEQHPSRLDQGTWWSKIKWGCIVPQYFYFTLWHKGKNMHKSCATIIIACICMC